MLARRLSNQVTKTRHIRTFFSGSSDSVNDMLKQSVNKFGKSTGTLVSASSAYLTNIDIESTSKALAKKSVLEAVNMLEELDKEVLQNEYFKNDQITIGVNLGPINISVTKRVK